MGYSIIKQQDHNNSYYTEYVIDKIEDIAQLPTQRQYAGNAAICLENSEVYILNTKGEWVML